MGSGESGWAVAGAACAAFALGGGCALLAVRHGALGGADGAASGQIKGQVKPDAAGRMAAGRDKVARKALEDMEPTRNDLLLRAARGEETERVPVWMMRQAGRYLPEFRELRKRCDFFTMCQTPELACEVTLQPLERFHNLDAVIVFSDILVVPQAMGMECRMIPGKGPTFPEPLRTPEDLEKLNFKPDLEDTLGYVFDVVNLTRQRVKGRVPVIGFAGAPFTLMNYMVEGGGSRNLAKAKGWLLNYPEASHRLLQGLTDIIVEYVVGKVAAGAQLLQIFESNGGDLTPELYREFSRPYLVQIVDRVKARLEEDKLPVVPMTVFARGVNSEGAIEDLAETQYDVVGVDWCIDASEARKRVPASKKTLQGNLDPCTLYASKERIYEEVEKMIKKFGTKNYIANLGHGMLPDHNPEHARAFIDAVQKVSAEMNQAKASK